MLALSSIDVYLLRGYFRRFVLWLAVFALVMLAVQVKQDMDRFTSGRTSAATLAWYFCLYLPYLTLMVVPVSSIIAAVTTFVSLARHRELTAMMAAGLSPVRIGLAPALASLAMYAVIFFFGEWVAVPGYAHAHVLAAMDARTERGASALRQKVRLPGVNNRLYLAETFLVQANVLQDVTVLQLDAEHRRCEEIIQAEAAVWERGRWVFHRGKRTVRSASGGREVTPFERLEYAAALEKPEAFERFSRDASHMTFAELRQYIRLLKRVGEDSSRLLPDLGLKLVFPLSCFLMTVIGTALVLRNPMAPLVSTLVAAVAAVMVYYVLLVASLRLGDGVLVPAWVSTFGPTIVLGAVAAYLYFSARAEG